MGLLVWSEAEGWAVRRRAALPSMEDSMDIIVLEGCMCAV